MPEMNDDSTTRPIDWRDPRVWLVPCVALLTGLSLHLAGLNTAAFLQLNALGTVTPTLLWSVLSASGDGLVLFALMLPFIGRRPDVVWAMALTAIIATLIVHGLKPLLEVPRPAAVLDADAMHVIGRRLRARNAFPSGHSAAAFAFAGVLALTFRRRWLFVLAVAAASLIALSRTVVGAHWPLDVTAGAFVGWGAAVAGTTLAAGWRWGLRPVAQRVFLLVLLVCALTLPWYDTGYADARGWQWLVALFVLVVSAPALRSLARDLRALMPALKHSSR